MTLVTRQITSSVDIHISLINLGNIPSHHQLGDPSYRVCLKVDGNEFKSAPVLGKSSTISLKNTFTLPVTLSSRLELKLLCLHHKVRKDHVIGEAAIQLLDIARHQDIILEWLKPENSKPGGKVMHKRGTITIRVKVDNTYHAPSKMVITSESRGTAANAAVLGTTIKALQRNLDRSPPQWANLLVSLTALVKLAGAFAEINPKAKVASGAVSFAFEMVTMQVLRDERINGLVGSMANLYSFVHDANALDKITSLEGTVVRLIKQTTECAYFITEYSRTDSFVRRAAVNRISNVDALIGAFEVAFGELKIEFIMGATLQTALISARILEKVDNITSLIHVEKLPYIQGASFDPSCVCLRGTCTSIIDDISNWVITGSVRGRTGTPGVFLLLGGPQCGKSAISHTIAQTLHSDGRLGSAIFLAREVADRNTPRMIFSTIARKLAAFDKAILETIASAISGDPDLPSAAIERQFQELILNPIRSLTFIGPIVIVIDGLDECKERARLLKIIAKGFVHLPSNFRVLITSRPEADIMATLQGLDHCHIQEMTFDDGSPEKDIPGYVSKTLTELEARRPEIFDEQRTRVVVHHELVQRAMGINVWATLACKFISVVSDEEAIIFLDAIFSEPVTKDPEAAIDHLYQSILHSISRLPSSDSYHCETGCEIAFGILSLAKPNSISHIGESDELCLQEAFLEFYPIEILVRIGCMRVQPLSNDGSRHVLVVDRLFEYFIDRQRCTLLNRPILVRDCLIIMNDLLASNTVAGIEDKSLLNSEIPRRGERIQKCVPQALQYAVQHWAVHLADIEPSEVVMEQLYKLLFKHLLHWIELASLMGLYDTILPSLKSLNDWLKYHNCADLELTTMVTNIVTSIEYLH